MNITLTIDDPEFPITRGTLVELFKTMHSLNIRLGYDALTCASSSISMEPSLYAECMKLSRATMNGQPEGAETQILGIKLKADKDITGIKFNITV